jgi:hypothetical protein
VDFRTSSKGLDFVFEEHLGDKQLKDVCEEPPAGTLSAAVAEDEVCVAGVGHEVLASFLGRGVFLVEAIGVVFVGVGVDVAVAVDGVLGDTDFGAVGEVDTIREEGSFWCDDLSIRLACVASCEEK